MITADRTRYWCLVEEADRQWRLHDQALAAGRVIKARMHRHRAECYEREAQRCCVETGCL